MNMDEQVSLEQDSLESFKYITKIGIAGSYERPSFSFLRNIHGDFHSGRTNMPF